MTNNSEKREFKCKECERTVITLAFDKSDLCSDCKEVLYGNSHRAKNSEEFDERYEKWVESALEETNDGSGGVIADTPNEELEVYENGQVHVKGSLIVTEANFVTPWKESEFFCHNPIKQGA